MFFDSCKFVINDRHEYLKFSNHYIDVLHGKSSMISPIKSFPLYVYIDNDDSLTVNWTYKEYEFQRRNNTYITLDTFTSYKYILHPHFVDRFNERYEAVSKTRMKKLLKNMVKNGKHLKRKDAIQLLKYHKTSDYILCSKIVNTDKVYYLIVISNINIMTTIYEFENMNDLKYFKEI